MERGALFELSREQLIELVLGLAAEVAEVKAQIGQPPKTPGNSSVPPSVGFRANRAERRARKRRAGNDGISRRRQQPDAIVRCRPTTGEGCGERVPLSGQRRVGRSQVVELPPIRTVVVEAWQYAARCSGCGTRTKGAYPEGLEPTRTFGPQIEALLGYVHERHHVSYERLAEVCRDLFGLQISEGGIDAALRRLAERARLTDEAIGAEVRVGPVIGSDETGARVAGTTAWQWVFQTPDASYHVIVPRRNAEVIAAFLGETRPEGWVSDLWSPQLQIEHAVDRLIARTFLPEQPDTANARRLQARYLEHRASLFVFFDRPDVPPTTNASEQDLRPSVIHRKVTGGFRSQAGADGSAIFTSLLATARKRGDNLFQALRSVAGTSPLHPAGLPT